MELECKRSNASIKPIIDHGKNLTPKDLYTGKAHSKHGAVRLTDLDQAKDQDFRSMTSVFNAPNSALSANSIMGNESGIFGRSLKDSSMRRMSVQNRRLELYSLASGPKGSQYLYGSTFSVLCPWGHHQRFILPKVCCLPFILLLTSRQHLLSTQISAVYNLHPSAY